DNYLAATMEQLSVHVNLDTRRSQAFPDSLLHSLQAAAHTHATVPLPDRHRWRLSLARRACCPDAPARGGNGRIKQGCPRAALFMPNPGPSPARTSNAYASILDADSAWVSMNARRGSTSSPISVVKISSAAIASSIFTRSRRRTVGSIVVSHSCSGFISPRPV